MGTAGVEIIPETLVNMGLVAHRQGGHERAETSFREALAMSQNVGRKPSFINALEGMAGLAGAQGEAARAARLWGAAKASREVTGIPLPTAEWELHEPYLAAARSRLGEAVWEEALAEGRAMSPEEVVEYALSKEEIAPPAGHKQGKPPTSESISELTSREEEVTLLVARGLTNRQVSTKLGISERTAGNHVARVLRKLGLRSRAQIARWATERRLLMPDQD